MQWQYVTQLNRCNALETEELILVNGMDENGKIEYEWKSDKGHLDLKLQCKNKS